MPTGIVEGKLEAIVALITFDISTKVLGVIR